MSASPTYTPPPRRSQRHKARVIGSILLVAVSAVLMWLVVDFASERPDQANLPGGDTFVLGEAERFAERIDEQDAPLLFKDPLSSRPGREIYVIHDGEDPESGWSAVLAYAPGAAREVECILQWDRDEQVFRDPCGTGSYPSDDARLTRYAATVNVEDDVEVDLRAE